MVVELWVMSSAIRFVGSTGGAAPNTETKNVTSTLLVIVKLLTNNVGSCLILCGGCGMGGHLWSFNTGLLPLQCHDEQLFKLLSAN